MKVAVYGSLRKGFGNHTLIDHCNKEWEGYVLLNNRKMVAYCNAFPAVVVSKLSCPFIAEVYEIDEQTLARLDRLEGFPHFYNREKITTPVGDAWMYYIADSSLDTLPSIGDWKQEKNNVGR